MFSNFASSFAWLAPSEQNVISTAGFYERRSRGKSRKRSGKSVYDLVKIKNQSRKQSHKRNGVGVRRIRTFPFSSYSARGGGGGTPIYGLCRYVPRNRVFEVLGP